MAIETEGQVQKGGSAVWEPLFAWRTGGNIVLDPSSWPNGATKFRMRRRDTSTGLVSPWSSVRTVTLAVAVTVAEPFLVLDGIPLRVVRGRFRRLADEVSLSGVRARTREADVNVFADADAEEIHALASHNLRRTIGGQIRGSGAGDVVLSGRAMGVAATVRLEVDRDEYAPDGTEWYRTISLRLREQVSP